MTGIETAAGDWNSRTNRFTLVKVADTANRDFKARNNNFGNTGWSGLWHKEGNTAAGPACSGGRWVPKDALMSINNFYNSGSGDRRRGVAVHEFGHSMGLDHENGSAGPCGSDYGYLSIMYYSDDRFNGFCSVFVPTNDDLQGIAALY